MIAQEEEIDGKIVTTITSEKTNISFADNVADLTTVLKGVASNKFQENINALFSSMQEVYIKNYTEDNPISAEKEAVDLFEDWAREHQGYIDEDIIHEYYLPYLEKHAESLKEKK